MLKIVPSNQFKKDLKLAKKRGCKIGRLQEAVSQLAQNQKLDITYRDHALSGNYQGFRECHIDPDWLLIYHVSQNSLELFLFRTGTHSALF